MRTTHAFIGLLVALAGCASPPDDRRERLSAFLNGQLGKSEADLVRAMKRIPDTNYQPDANTRMLLWRLEATVRTPGRSPDYVATGYGIVAVGGRPDTYSKEYCNVEWLIKENVATSYKWQGDGCP